MGSDMGVRVTMGGTAAVFCVHDRQKDQVTTEEQVAALGLELPVPIIYDVKIHKLFKCTCCRNLFFDISDEPRFCSVCSGQLVHPLGGPLPEPGGVIS